jgi:hypothetical protein
MQNIKEKLPWKLSESKPKMLKGIGQLIAFVLFGVLIFLWIGSPSKQKKEPVPTTFQTKPVETKPLPFENQPSFSSGFNKAEEGIENDLVEVLMTNTMGSYQFPEKGEKKLRMIVRDLFKNMDQDIFDAYKDKKVNLSALDTMSNAELYKILQ